MSISLKENYEKILLALLLVLLALASIISIIEVNAKDVTLIIGGGKTVSANAIPVIAKAENSFFKGLPEKSLQPFVYCRNSKCNYLIHKSLVKCTWCTTPIVAVERIDNDLNRNKIDDRLELKWGLKLDDPDELLRDLDGDGFSAKDEYERDSSPIDSSSHPPLALRATFEGIKSKYIPFRVNDVVIVIDVRGNRRVYVDGIHFKRGSFYLSVGEHTDWLKIINAGEVNGEKFAELQYFDFKFRIKKGEKLQYPGWPKFIVRNGITGSSVSVTMESDFKLESIKGAKESYRLVQYDKLKKEIKVSSEVLSNEFILNKKEALEKPLK